MQLYFCYGSGIMAIPAVIGNSVVSLISIAADAPFEAKYLTISVTQVNLVVTNWGGTIQIDDSAKGRTLFNNAIGVDHIRGNGGLPYAFNPPRLFDQNSSITITVTNNVATATNVEVVLHGNKLVQGI